MSETKELVERLRAMPPCRIVGSLPRSGVPEVEFDLSKIEAERKQAADLIERLEARAERAEAERDALAKARNEVLEEAAKAAEARGEQYADPAQYAYDMRQGCYDAAAAIRALSTLSTLTKEPAAIREDDNG